MNCSQLFREILKCKVCEPELPLGANPIFRANTKAKILVVGQAPGIRVHNTGIPWNDPSGKNLRNWLGVRSEEFYDDSLFGIVPMGFCYPGKGKSGDLPPRKECAPLWHQPVLDCMPKLHLKLLVGSYAQAYYLKDRKRNLTETVRNYREYLPDFLPLPHPSPRNKLWQKKNPWFEEDVLPYLKSEVQKILQL
ncbi:MAG: uracil-DNA glycosylase family protein [Cytophagales bacterium]|nr:uracil-DNA glycosylase family protein [Cytophagales bacterium]